jgi:hypothetical protein
MRRYVYAQFDKGLQRGVAGNVAKKFLAVSQFLVLLLKFQDAISPGRNYAANA